MQTSYFVDVIDYSTGRTLARLGTNQMRRLRYRRVLNGVGMVQFTLPGDSTAAAYLEKHTWIEVYRCATVSSCELEGTFIVVTLERYIDENDREWLLVAGASMEFLLQQRIVDPRNDPGGGGWSTKSGPADTVMAELVEQQAGPSASAHGPTPSQQVPGLTVATPSGSGETVAVREQWSNLLTVLQTLAEGDRMDFRIERGTGTALTFYAERIGSDKTFSANAPGGHIVMLSPELGRLNKARLRVDWSKEATVVYLMGKGAGDYRDLYGTVASKADETPYSYAALVQNARNADGVQEYVTQATDALSKHARARRFQFTVVNPARQYKTLWDLGDWVTVSWRDFKQDMRITEIDIQVSDGGEQITPKLRERYAGS